MVRDIDERPTLEQAIKHPLFAEIDFDNIPDYNHFQQQTTSGDRLVMQCQKEVLAQMKLNQDIL